MYYDNSNSVSSTAVSADVWDLDYAMVQHMNQTSGSIVGSTTNTHTGTRTDIGSATTTYEASGQIGDGIHLNTNKQSSGDHFNIPNHSSLQVTPNITMESWIKGDSTNIPVWISKGGNLDYVQFVVTASDVSPGANNNPVLRLNNGAIETASNTVVNDNVWHHVVSTYDGTNMRVYIDGAISITTAGTTTIPTNTNPLLIGAFSTGGALPWFGTLDEIRISNVVRSADWITTEYNNQNTPNTFMAFTVEAAPSIEETDSLGVTDSASLSPNISSADSITPSDSATLVQTIVSADSVTVIDSVDGLGNLSESDGIPPSDSVSVSTNISSADSITPSDSATLVQTIVSADSITPSDSATFPLSYSDSVTPSDSIDGMSNQSPTDSISVSPNVSSTDSVTVTDLAEIVLILKVSDSVSPSDSVSGMGATATSDSVTVTDSARVAKSIIEFDSLSVTDSVTEMNTLGSSVDSLSPSDSTSNSS